MIDESTTDTESQRRKRAADLCRRFAVNFSKESIVLEIILHEENENGWYSRMEDLRERYGRSWFAR